MGASEGYTFDPTALREHVARLSSSHVRYRVLALTIGCIIALAVLKADGAGSQTLTDALGGVLAVAFILLALIDFRASVAVVIFELVLGGAGGHWAEHGSLTGRIFLIAVVTLRAAWLTIADWRRGRHPLLGRYGAHALAIAILMPAIWMPLGLINGNLKHNIVSDGNGFLFFAFVLVVVTLLRSGDGVWFQNTFFAACAVNAAAYVVLIAVSASGAVSLETMSLWLNNRLDMGGVIGYMPNGAYRLFTGGSLFLPVGLALVTQRLLARPRDARLWLVGALLSTALVATYTRGLWLAAVVAVLLVLALGVRSVRQLGISVAIPSAVGVLALVIAPLAGFSLYGYITERASTITVAGTPTYSTRIADPSFEASSSVWVLNAPARSLSAQRTRSAARTGAHSLELSNTAAGQDAYAFQNLTVRPHTRYAVTAWVDARGFRQPAAAQRGLLVWNAQEGNVYTVPLVSRTNGWRRLVLAFATKANAKDLQIRLYAPQGRVLWDDVHLAVGRAAQRAALAAGGNGRHRRGGHRGQHRPGSKVEVASIPGTAAAGGMALGRTGYSGRDAAGAASNSYRIAEAKALWGYIKRRPIQGYGFGSIATDFSTSYSYELSYLDLLFKTGILGFLLFLSFPVRLVVDAWRLRRGHRLELPGGGRVALASGAVVGVIGGILAAGATNPYLFAAFGLVSILAMVAWLEEAQAPGER